MDAGAIANTATATATPPPGVASPESAPSEATVPAVETPALTLAKSATPTMVTGAGQVITYSFAITNTGNVTMTHVTVTDPMSGLSAVSCPGATLAPDASMTCTAKYTTTADDVASGSITNAATAAGVEPDGASLRTVKSTAIVRVAPAAPASPITPVTVHVTG
jgi:uncharacterized repeat protein (TIGR01451 family)